MTWLALIWKNLWRSRVRTTLTAVSLAVSLFLVTLLMATLHSMQSVASASAGHLRLVVHHKTTMTKLLPLGQRATLSAMPDVASVCGMRWFGGRPERGQEQFPSMALDTETFPVVFDDFELSRGDLQVWKQRRTAAIVGMGLAGRLGVKPGDRVCLKGTIPPYLNLEFEIAGITRAAAYPNVFVFRLDYLLDALRAVPVMPAEHNNSVNLYWVRVNRASAMESVRQAVDAGFANTPDPTMTEFEASFVAQFTKMFGDIPVLVRDVGLVVLGSIVLVVCNTMSSAVRERTSELAVLKAIGFTSSRLVALLMGEAALLGLIGGTGSLVATVAVRAFEASGMSMPYFPIIRVSPAITLAGVAASILLNLAAAVPSAIQVARLSVTRSLRTIA